MNLDLLIKAYVWNKDSILLYDYETPDITTTIIKTKKNIDIVRSLNQVLVSDENNKTNSIYMISIIKQPDNYYIRYDHEKIKIEKGIMSTEGKPWFSIKQSFSTHTNGFRLRESDIIKIGKICFKVREIKAGNQIQQYEKIDDLKTYQEEKFRNTVNIMKNHDEFHNQTQIVKDQKNIIQEDELNENIQIIKKTPTCRICLGDSKDNINSLICPCKCSGTMKYIHIDCLKLWLKSKITTKSYTYLTVHSFKNLECELCKVVIPEKIKIKEEIYYLFEFKRPENKYIILESVGKENAKNERKFLYILNFKEKNSIRIGRANDSDVRISDISVSRNHSSIIYESGKYYLSDHSSKFGTLVQISNELIILPSKLLSIQSGKSNLKFILNQSCLSYLKCFRYYSPFDDYSDYYDFNITKNKEEIKECGYNGSEQVSEVVSNHENNNIIIDDDVSRIQGAANSFIDKGTFRADTCELSPVKTMKNVNQATIRNHTYQELDFISNRVRDIDCEVNANVTKVEIRNNELKMIDNNIGDATNSNLLVMNENYFHDSGPKQEIAKNEGLDPRQNEIYNFNEVRKGIENNLNIESNNVTEENQETKNNKFSEHTNQRVSIVKSSAVVSHFKKSLILNDHDIFIKK